VDVELGALLLLPIVDAVFCPRHNLINQQHAGSQKLFRQISSHLSVKSE
jgi:hypothetical protein